jgi:hypothetical protein
MDPEALGARGASLVAKLREKQVRARRVRWTAWGSGLSAAAAVTIVVAIRAQHTGTVGHSAPVDASTPVERVAALRSQASASCERKLYDECERNLDDAKALDPQGENDAHVQSLRDALRRAKR